MAETITTTGATSCVEWHLVIGTTSSSVPGQWFISSHTGVDTDIWVVKVKQSFARKLITWLFIFMVNAVRVSVTHAMEWDAIWFGAPRCRDVQQNTFPSWSISWASYQIRKTVGCACAGNAGNIFPRRRLRRILLVSDPGMHHDTCVTHVSWCMSGLLTCDGGENDPGIPGACAPAILRIRQEAHSDSAFR